MRKIDLNPYNVETNGKDKDGNPIVLPYEVQESIINALYSSELHLGAMELLNNDRLAQKIKSGDKLSLLLEEEEYSRLRRAFESIHNYSRDDVELVRRVMEAPDVPVKEG